MTLRLVAVFQRLVGWQVMVCILLLLHDLAQLTNRWRLFNGLGRRLGYMVFEVTRCADAHELTSHMQPSA